VVRGYCVLLFMVLAGIVSCASKEQVYEGLYQGFSSANETQMTRDPSYDPVREQDRKKQSYQDYKYEREQELKK